MHHLGKPGGDGEGADVGTAVAEVMRQVRSITSVTICGYIARLSHGQKAMPSEGLFLDFSGGEQWGGVGW